MLQNYKLVAWVELKYTLYFFLQLKAVCWLIGVKNGRQGGHGPTVIVLHIYISEKNIKM